MERFLHPAVRACINPETKEFFDFALHEELVSGVSGPDSMAKIAPPKAQHNSGGFRCSAR